MMPLFEIVGVTATYLTYLVGFSFMTSDKEHNFTWALQALLKLLNPNSDMPKVVVTDRDMTMMKAVGNVLSDSSALLCYFRVGKNVRAYIITDCKVKQKVVIVDGEKKLVDEVEHSENIVDTIFHAWEKLGESPTQELYASNLMELQDACMLHLGCRMTNRVEGAHGRVKEYLSTSKGNLGTCWEK